MNNEGDVGVSHASVLETKENSNALSSANPEQQAGGPTGKAHFGHTQTSSTRVHINIKREQGEKKTEYVFEYEVCGCRIPKRGTLSAIGQWLLARGMADPSGM
jgi:hypothetical protein